MQENEESVVIVCVIMTPYNYTKWLRVFFAPLSSPFL